MSFWLFFFHILQKSFKILQQKCMTVHLIFFFFGGNIYIYYFIVCFSYSFAQIINCFHLFGIYIKLFLMFDPYLLLTTEKRNS